MTSTRPLRSRSGSPRSVRFLLTLALLPAAGVTLAGVGIASASDDAPKTAVARTAAVPRHAEPGDDRGTDVRSGRPTEHSTVRPSTAPRAPEAGDDSGGHGGRGATATTAARTSRPVTTRATEPGDDSAVSHHQTRTRTRSADDAVRHSSSSARPSATRAPEAGDDSGGHGGRTVTPRAPEAGDDSGGHGGRGGSGSSSGSGGSGTSGHHGGSDDGAHHS
jgi:hypothetical protein